MLVIGSGFGIPYHEGDVPLNLEELGQKIAAIVQRLKQSPRFARKAGWFRPADSSLGKPAAC